MTPLSAESNTQISRFERMHSSIKETSDKVIGFGSRVVTNITEQSNKISNAIKDSGEYEFATPIIAQAKENPLWQYRGPILGIVSNILIFSQTLLAELNKGLEHIKGLGQATGALGLISIIDLRTLPSDIKNYTKMAKNAVKTNEIVKAVLNGILTAFQVISVPLTVLRTLAPFVENLGEVTKMGQWVPGLSVALTLLSTAAIALKAINFHETLKFTKATKNECCKEIIRALHNDLSDSIDQLQPELREKLARAKEYIPTADTIRPLKNIKDELLKKFPDVSILMSNLESLKAIIPSSKNQFLEDLQEQLFFYEFNDCLSNSTFKKEAINEISKQIDSAFSAGEGIDFPKLKKELKAVLKEIEPSVIEALDRASKKAYLNMVASYNAKSLTQYYQLTGADIKDTSKKTLEVAENHFKKGNVNKADELLSIQYKELKSRVCLKTTWDKIGFALSAISMIGATIGLAFAFGSLPSPAAPASLAIGITLGAIGLGITLVKAKQNQKAEDSLGITEKKFADTLNEIDKKTLTPDNQKIYDKIKMQIAEGNFDIHTYSECKLTKMDKNATDEEKKLIRSGNQSAKDLNSLIKEMNRWGDKRQEVIIDKRARHWNNELNKIDISVLNPDQAERVAALKNVFKTKQMDPNSLVKLGMSAINNPKQTLAIERFNKVVESMVETNNSRLEAKIMNLEAKIENYDIRIKEGQKLLNVLVDKNVSKEVLFHIATQGSIPIEKGIARVMIKLLTEKEAVQASLIALKAKSMKDVA